MVFIMTVASEIHVRQATYSDTGMCSTDTPYTLQKSSIGKCALDCLKLAICQDYSYNKDTKECALFLHKPLFYSDIPGCAGFKARMIFN